MRIEHHELRNELLDRYPVWAWVEDELEESRIYPVVVEGDILPNENTPLLIRAYFLTPEGKTFRGTVCWDIEVFAVGIIIGEDKFSFNIKLRDLARKSLEGIGHALGREVSMEDFFPLSYKTGFCSADGEEITGVFNFVFEEAWNERT